MLPPDNFQEDPDPRRRTSHFTDQYRSLPVVGCERQEFGWIGLGDATTRLERTMATLHRMEKYRGHLYNWYDTQDLRPLDPKYVSTVDSGNLAGHLIALANYCEHWIIEPSDNLARLDGLNDILNILVESLGAIPNDRRNLRAIRKTLAQRFPHSGKALAMLARRPNSCRCD